MARHGESFGSSGMCPIRGVSAIQGAGLEGFHCTSTISANVDYTMSL